MPLPLARTKIARFIYESTLACCPVLTMGEVEVCVNANYYSPTLKKGGYIGFGLSVNLLVLPSVCHNFVSAQYLENKLIDFHQILYMHSH